MKPVAYVLILYIYAYPLYAHDSQTTQDSIAQSGYFLTQSTNNGLTLVETGAIQQSEEFLATSRYRMEEQDRERRVFSEKALISYALGVGQGGRHEKELAQLREQAADLGYLNMPAATVVPGHRESLLGFEVARRLGNGDVWGTAQRVIEQLPEEQREAWSQRLHSCKTRRDGEIVLGEAFTAAVQYWYHQLSARYESADVQPPHIPQARKDSNAIDISEVFELIFRSTPPNEQKAWRSAEELRSNKVEQLQKELSQPQQGYNLSARLTLIFILFASSLVFYFFIARRKKDTQDCSEEVSRGVPNKNKATMSDADFIEQITAFRNRYKQGKEYYSYEFKKLFYSEDELNLLTALSWALKKCPDGYTTFHRPQHNLSSAIYHRLYGEIFWNKHQKCPYENVTKYLPYTTYSKKELLQIIDFFYVLVAVSVLAVLAEEGNWGAFFAVVAAAACVIIYRMTRYISNLHTSVWHCISVAAFLPEAEAFKKSHDFLCFLIDRYKEDSMTREQRDILRDYISRHPVYIRFFL